MDYKRDVREFLGWILRILRERGCDRSEAKMLVRKSGLIDVFRNDKKSASFIMHRDVDAWCDDILEAKGRQLVHAVEW